MQSAPKIQQQALTAPVDPQKKRKLPESGKARELKLEPARLKAVQLLIS